MPIAPIPLIIPQGVIAPRTPVPNIPHRGAPFAPLYGYTRYLGALAQNRAQIENHALLAASGNPFAALFENTLLSTFRNSLLHGMSLDFIRGWIDRVMDFRKILKSFNELAKGTNN